MVDQFRIQNSTIKSGQEALRQPEHQEMQH